MSVAKPIITLSVIVALISALIIVVYNITYVDTSGILTDKQEKAVVSIYGGTGEDYQVVPVSEWQEMMLGSTDGFLSDNAARIQKVIRKRDGSLAFEVVVKGYKDGFDILVGVKDGAVAGVAVVSTGEETPGLGTNTNTPEFLDSFKGIDTNAVIVKTTPAKDNEVQAVTSATFSSKGVANAVNIALSAYREYIRGGEAQ